MHAPRSVRPSRNRPTDNARQILVMLHLPVPHYRPGANYAATIAIRPATPRAGASRKDSRANTA